MDKYVSLTEVLDTIMSYCPEEILKVKSLGESIGYGNLMDIASIL